MNVYILLNKSVLGDGLVHICTYTYYSSMYLKKYVH